MNKPKYTVGDTVYYLHQVGIQEETIEATRKDQRSATPRFLYLTEDSDLWKEEQNLFPTAEACLEFAKESAKKFMPSTGSNEPIETREDDKPVKFRAGDRVRLKKDHSVTGVVERADDLGNLKLSEMALGYHYWGQENWELIS